MGSAHAFCEIIEREIVGATGGVKKGLSVRDQGYWDGYNDALNWVCDLMRILLDGTD